MVPVAKRLPSRAMIALCFLVFFASVARIQAKAKENLKEVTHEVYFDIEIDGKPTGRITMGLFGKGKVHIGNTITYDRVVAGVGPVPTPRIRPDFSSPNTIENVSSFATTGFEELVEG
ncbi:hypothetical protein Taro_003368 [Colocasia esculenta]|uniref:Peptidylprolyl isomerase n=1 Tax=Colocasia esculenta TaxID=4460 RepID=A0A843TGW3_COLES|nr:hypothetical protein [Colocasia esculenta]